MGVIQGENAVTGAQMKSSFICGILGNALFLLLITSALLWLKINKYILVAIVLIYISYAAKRIRTSILLFAVSKSVKEHADAEEEKESGGDQHNEKALYYANEEWRITEPTERFCWIIFGFEILFYFIIPLIAMFTSPLTHNVGAVFVPVFIITSIRRYLNITTYFKELGTLTYIEQDNIDEMGEIDKGSAWREKHQLSTIVGKITHGRRHNF